MDWPYSEPLLLSGFWGFSYPFWACPVPGPFCVRTSDVISPAAMLRSCVGFVARLLDGEAMTCAGSSRYPARNREIDDFPQA